MDRAYFEKNYPETDSYHKIAAANLRP
jgi:hypothetical protein